MIAVTNCKFFDGKELVTGKSVLIQKDKIVCFTEGQIPAEYKIVDAGGNYISPGFVDLQIYGSGGNLFSAYPQAETLRQMDFDLTSKGTTSFLACVATNTSEIVYQSITAAKLYRAEANGFLGLHLEGPYLNYKRKGAHIEACIRKASLDDVKQLMDYADGTIKMMTIAAELQDDVVLNYLSDQGIVLSLGHSDANFEQATHAYNHGFAATTHLFNAMPSIHHRAPNLPVAVFNHQKAMASIIADGNHVDFEIIKMSHKLMNERLFLITDAVTPCNIGHYQHRISGEKYVTPDGTLSGSSITLLQAVKNCIIHCDISLADALNMASLYPSRLMKMTSQIGDLSSGTNADIVFLSEDMELKKVIAKGIEC